MKTHDCDEAKVTRRRRREERSPEGAGLPATPRNGNFRWTLSGEWFRGGALDIQTWRLPVLLVLFRYFGKRSGKFPVMRAKSDGKKNSGEGVLIREEMMYCTS